MSVLNNNKTKNWFHRLRHLKIRRQSLDTIEDSNGQGGTVVYRRGVSSLYNSDPPSQHPRARNTFRRSIMKMHTRMKNVFRHNSENNNNHTVESVLTNSTSPSHSQSRITLGSPARYTENIYSLEPTKKSLTPPPPRNSLLQATSRLDSSLLEDLDSVPTTTPVVPPRRKYAQLSDGVQNSRVPKNEIANLSKFYWYWGPISRGQAEERLKDSPDGAFLVRDSTSDRYLFTMSFRSIGKVLHTRIEFSKTGYSLFDQVGYNSVAELVEDAIVKSQNSVYCYTKTRDDIHPNFPVRLTLPVSRYDKVPTLKYLSRFVIRQSVIINDMEKLPLPVSLIAYLKEEGPYF